MSLTSNNRNKNRGKKGRFVKYSQKKPCSDDFSCNNSNDCGAGEHCYSRNAARKVDGSDIELGACEELLSSDESWMVGRRVVELDVLADGLSSCIRCSIPLQLKSTMKSRNFGLAMSLDVYCYNCGTVNIVHTGRKHGKIYDVNTKLALAMLHAGVGFDQINSILSTLNIPNVSHTMLVRRQNEAGVAVESVAKDSIEKSLEDELNLNEHDKKEIEVSVDAGWQKRGSGKAYDSLSGHCTMIGVKSGKVVSYAVRSKTCRVCSSNKAGMCYHDCRKNWSGSSKAMEPDMVVEMVTKTSEKGVLVTSVVGDDDSTTYARLKQTAPHKIEKKSDKNHVRKNLSNQLNQLRTSIKGLPSKVISYIMKLFNYCIASHKNDPIGISKGLDAVINHPFGNHTFCDESWCRFISNPNARYTSLPFGKPLSDSKLKDALSSVFGAYKKIPNKLSNLGSTQANESLNSSIAKKAPKHLHLSGSANLCYRVAASVAQKNLGHGYLSNVNEKLGMSPGTYTKKLVCLRDLQHRKRKAIAITRAAKQRRMKLKHDGYAKQVHQEVREGPTYVSNIGEEDVDLTTIPPPLPHPGSAGFDTAGADIVFFDLETTGLDRTAHITQIAAVHKSNQFSVYVVPQKNISAKAAEVTGVTMIGQTMLVKGIEVEAIHIKNALDGFISFLNKSSPIILAGHNIESFDCKVLFNSLQN